MDDLVIHFTTEGGDCFMTIERAMEILDPKHRENYESIAVVEEAMQIGRSALALLKRDAVYVCYIENHNDLADTNGAISDLTVRFNKADVLTWAKCITSWAFENGYVTNTGDDVSEKYFFPRTYGFSRFRLFWKSVGNDNVSFDIVVWRKRIGMTKNNILEVSE